MARLGNLQLQNKIVLAGLTGRRNDSDTFVVSCVVCHEYSEQYSPFQSDPGSNVHRKNTDVSFDGRLTKLQKETYFPRSDSAALSESWVKIVAPYSIPYPPLLLHVSALHTSILLHQCYVHTYV